MPITPEQRKARRKYLGSSDMAALVGLDPWTSASDVYLEKTGELLDADEDSLIQDIGQTFEQAVIDLFSKRRGVTVERNVNMVHGIYACNLDGLIRADLEIVEAKTTGKIDEWGDEYTDNIPEQHIIQVHEQMYVTSQVTGQECRVAWVPVLLPGYHSLQFKIFKVTRNDDLLAGLIEIGNNFWENNVLKGIQPDPFEPKMEILKRVRRRPDSVADISDQIILDWMNADAIAKAADSKMKSAKARLIAALGDAEGGESPKGRCVTYLEQSRAGYTVEPCSYRVLRAPKARQPN